MAQAVFNDEIRKLKIDAFAFSRGLFANGEPISNNASLALCEIGISGFEHISETVSENDIVEADYVIGISSSHAAKLIADFPLYCNKIYAFPKDISDPYGGNPEVYRRTLSEIQEGVKYIISEVFPNVDNI